MPDTPICPIMSRTVAVETIRISETKSGDENPSVIGLFQPCIGSKCAWWHPDYENKSGKPYGWCGLPHTPIMSFPDPAKQDD